MLHKRVGTKAVLNTQRKSISTAIRKEPEISYGLMHHFFKPLKLTLQNHSSDYWINIFQSLIHYTRLQKYYQSQLYEQCVAIHKTKHNKNVFNKKEKETNSCNCRNKNECPLEIAKYRMLSTYALYLKHKYSKNVSIWEWLKVIGSNYCIITVF